MKKTKNIFTQIIIFLLFVLCQVVPAQGQTFILDTTFQTDYNFLFHMPGQPYQGSVAKIVELPNKSLIVGGSFHDPMFGYNAIVNVDEDGMTNNSFSFIKGSCYFYTYAINNSDIYTISQFEVLKLDINTGERDFQFEANIDASGWGGSFSRFFVLQNGDFYIGGSVWHQGIYRSIGRIKANGYYDTTFTHYANTNVSQFHKYDDDRILVNGNFTQYDGVDVSCLIRIFNNGERDTTFNSQLERGRVMDVHKQDDGRIIVCGYFTLFNDTTKLAMVRLFPDGKLDGSFNNFNNVDGCIWDSTAVQFVDPNAYQIAAICPTANSKFIIGGMFTSCEGRYRGNIALVDKDGFLDTLAFNGSGIDTCLTSYTIFGVRDIISTDNDKYYVGGYFSRFDGTEVQPIFRMKADYSIIEEAPVLDPVIIFPNPAKDFFMVSFASSFGQNDSMLEVYSIDGRLVHRARIPSHIDELRVNTSMWQMGTYICHIKTASEIVVSKKLVIVK